MRALVTGATGFIGSHVCRALVAAGHSVRAFHRSRSQLIALEGLRVERAVGDVLDLASLRTAMRDVDVVFHAACRADHWRDPDGLVETIVTGTANVLHAAREARVGRVVFTSSAAALGLPRDGALLDETHAFNLPASRWPYGAAKQRAEDEVRQAARDLDCVIVNPTSAFGGADVNLITGTLIRLVARRRVPVTARGGMNVVHVADVAAGHLAAAAHGRRGERYILGGENLPHRAILGVIAEELGVRAPRVEAPPVVLAAAARALDIAGRVVRLPVNGSLLRLSAHRFYYDTRRARDELGLAAPRSFRAAVRDAVAWYRAAGVL
jgi:dihydroflavonol-4-reductase